MGIHLILLVLQVLLLFLYGVNGIAQSGASGSRRWIAAAISFAAIVSACLFLQDFVGQHIQLLLFLIIVLAYFVQLLAIDSSGWINPVLMSAIAFLAYSRLYFEWEYWWIWGIGLVLFIAIYWLISKQPERLDGISDYLLRAGVLLTLLFALEPVFFDIMKNLKPIPTIPVEEMINQNSLMLLGFLLLLVSGGFFWKEKSRS